MHHPAEVVGWNNVEAVQHTKPEAKSPDTDKDTERVIEIALPSAPAISR